MRRRRLRQVGFSRVQVRGPVTAFLMVALIAASLTIPPGTPGRGTGFIEQATDQPPLPTWVAAGAGELKYVDRALNGLVLDEYGHSLARSPDDAFLKRTTGHHVYAEGGITVERAIVDDVDRLADPGAAPAADMDLVTVGTVHGSSTRRLEIRGPLKDGFPVRTSIDLGPEVGELRGIAIMRGASAVEVLVVSTAGFNMYAFTGGALTPNGQAPSDPSQLLPDSGSSGMGTLRASDVLDAYQRPAWEHTPDEFHGPTNTFVITGRSPSDQNHLRTRLYTWNSSTGFRVELAGGDVDAGARVADARARYDAMSWQTPTAPFPIATVHKIDGNARSSLTTFGVPVEISTDGGVTKQSTGVQASNDNTLSHACTGEVEGMPDLDVEVQELPFKLHSTGAFGNSEFTVGYACAGVSTTPTSDGQDQLEVNTYRLDVRLGHFGSPSVRYINDAGQNNADRAPLQNFGHFAHPRVSLNFPCKAYLDRFFAERQLTNEGCKTVPDAAADSSTSTLVTNTLVRESDASGAPEAGAALASRSWRERQGTSGGTGCVETDPKTCLISRHDVHVFDVRDASGSHAQPFVFVKLPDQRRRLKVRFPDIDGDGRPDSRREQTRPIPVALLAAPPYVAGAGQVMDGPFFGQSSSTSDEREQTWETSFGFYLGVDIEVEAVDNPLPGPDVELDWEALGHITLGGGGGSGLAKTVTFTERYSGAPDANSIVYRVDILDVRDAEIVESSSGTGVGDIVEFATPIDSAVATTTESDFLRRFWDVRETFEQPFDDAFPTAGDPGSYLAYEPENTSAIDGYCIGDVTGGSTTPTDVVGFKGVGPNPFIVDDPAPGPDVLVGEPHEVQAGSSNISGTELAIEESQSRSRLTTFAFGAESYLTHGSLRWGVENESTFGGEETRSLTRGTTFGGEVSNIPDPDLSTEGYGWRAFLCKRNFNGAPIWVLNYTVKGYNGSGGLRELTTPRLIAPIQSKRVSTTPDLTFTQDRGTVRSFDLELEAVGTEDSRTVHDVLEASSAPEANSRIDDLQNRTLDWDEDLDLEPLKGGQLYRWRLTAIDFFDRTKSSDWQFFVTEGPAKDLELEISDQSPGVDEEITITATHAPTTVNAYRLDAGDGRDPIEQTSNVFTLSYAQTGLYLPKVEVVTPYGTTSESEMVAVGPQANDESFSAVEDTVLNVPAPGVLANDKGAESSSIVIDPRKGTVSLAANGAFTYTPNANACGSDTFVYGVRGGVTTRRATATINIACVNDAPTITSAVERTIDEDTTFVENPPGLLAHAADVDGDALHVSAVGAPTNGQLAFVPFGGWVYAPNENFCGADAFTFTVTDQHGESATGNGTMEVTCVNDAPEAPAVSASVDEDTTLQQILTATDPEGDPITWRTGAPASSGTSTVDANGRWTYAPAPNYCGPDSMSAIVGDGTDERTVPLGVTVVCVNDRPTAAAASATTAEDTSTAGSFAGSDIDAGDQLTYSIKTQPTHGTSAVDPSDPSRWTYTPAANYCGSDSFTYTASDSSTESNPATITVDVTCVNDAPAASDDDGMTNPTYRVNQGATLDVPAPGVLANDTDPDGDDLAVKSVTAVAHGTLTVNPNGSVRYVSDPSIGGPETVTVTIQDPSGLTSTSQLTIVVRKRTALDVFPAVKNGTKYRYSAKLSTTGTSAGPVAGEKLTFTSDTNAVLCTATTGADGIATCEATAAGLTLIGTPPYKAAFAGTALLMPATGSASGGLSSSSRTSPFGGLLLQRVPRMF